MTETARRQLDGHLEAAPRASGKLGARYQSISLEQLRAAVPDGGPVIVSIDLD
ncbi:MAG: hypothetical protein ABIR71_14325 [Chthoniobacterales bacterium]